MKTDAMPLEVTYSANPK